MIDDFLAIAGWGGAKVSAIPGDASFRRYYRVDHKAPENGLGQAMLMVAPPPEEDVKPFLHVAEYLGRNGLRAPEIFAADAEAGLVLLEDFGTDRMREAVDDMATEDEAAIYRKAVKTLTSLHRQTLPSLPPYDQKVYQREAELFCEWYCPAQGLEIDQQSFSAALDKALEPVLAAQDRPVVVLRDYHAENIMLLEEDKQGLLDFQDALLGHPAYDLVSLLQDARRDVSEELEQEMCDYFVSRTRASDRFLSDYALLGAQRNLKIIGIFTRLMKRDGKDRYLDYIPRVWRYLERDLAHPACAPLAEWFAANIPDDYRQGEGLIDRLKA
ncbi:phosphotransferase [Parasphingorhabdus sp. SCSIO 66989]|uniref:Phosphotransferase n=2 Tax=Alterisphingorhabdus coralli TaxID=3071408 RepID=A0AA97F9I1_9SPHN|nr:phosphotransferase [Parasphingorhabdus sp. SCSIO 66989]WOE76631.1 phosphotransferase [Parasphingorhabdus sp. SCSIO 66989]